MGKRNMLGDAVYFAESLLEGGYILLAIDGVLNLLDLVTETHFVNCLLKFVKLEK